MTPERVRKIAAELIGKGTHKDTFGFDSLIEHMDVKETAPVNGYRNYEEGDEITFTFCFKRKTPVMVGEAIANKLKELGLSPY